MEKRNKKKLKKLIYLLAGIILCILFAWIIPPPAALAAAAESVGSTGEQAMKILGATALAIIWWMGEVFSDWLTTIMLLILWVVLGGIPFTSAFSSYAGTSVWLIVGAFSLAAAVTKTGFFKRIASYLMQLFSPSFGGQVLALLIVGTLCAPLIPSSTAKAVLGASIALNIANAMGYEKYSSGRAGLFIASWIGFGAVVPAFLSGGVFNYTLYGALSDDVRAGVTWGSWFVAMILWLLLLLIGSFFGIRLLYQPKEKSTMTREYVKEEYRMLGKMSVREKQAAVLLAGAVLCWIFESRLGIHSSVTAMAAGFFCFALGILDLKEISTAVPWGLVIFLGGVLNLGPAFSRVGIDLWLQGILSPMFTAMNSRIIIVLVVAALVLIIRLFLASQSAVIVLMITILSPVVQNMGINPFVIGLVIYTTLQCWFLPYQNVVFVPAYSCVSDGIRYSQTVKACVMYEILSIVACLISIPYWGMLGLM